MKTGKMIRLTIIMIMISFMLTTIISVSSLKKVMDDDAEDMSMIMTARIYDRLNSELLSPIMVARTMSNDFFLKKQMKEEALVSEEEMTSEIGRYLYMIENEMEYNTAFIISEKSKKYYTYGGISKIISPYEDEYDSWYSTFTESGKAYDFDVATDDLENDVWTIFVNSRIEDEEGNLLGVCGVSIVMSDIQEILHDFEQEYGIKVYLINSAGFVEIDADSESFKKAVFEDVVGAVGNSGDYVYIKDKNLVAKYMDAFGWYLVISNEGKDFGQIFYDIIAETVIVFVLILLLLLICVRVLLGKEDKKLKESASTDQLTGLANRNYFKYNLEEKAGTAAKLYQSLAVFDIDRFKTINDTMGHLKDDEILKQVADIAKETVNEKGMVIRWGGDEFLILFKNETEEACMICEELRRQLEEKTKITVSIGVCSMLETIELGFFKADELLYMAKKGGRNRVESYIEPKEQ